MSYAILLICLMCVGILLWLQSIESRLWRLGRQVEHLEGSNSVKSGDVLFLELQKFLGVREPRLQEVDSQSEGDEPLPAIEVKQRIAEQVAEQIAVALTARPPLLKVISFSMWMTRDFTRDVASITDAELKELKGQVAAALFWPTSGMTAQEWTTHTVVLDDFEGFSRYRKTFYKPRPRSYSPTVLWSHTFRPKVEDGFADVFGPNAGALEIVLHENAIKCWGREGRFGGKYWSGEAEDRHVFITIPLDDEHVRPYLRPDEEPDNEGPVCLEPPYKNKPWHREYQHADPRGYGWNLAISDMVVYLRD